MKMAIARKQRKTKSKGERLLERSNNPILILAALAIVLYILELFRVVPKSLMTPFLWINFLIDFIFLLDLSAKVLILGRGYLRSPWFLIDFVSTMPIVSSSLELIGNVGPQLQATRAARAARVARVARIARLAKVARVARLATAIRARHGLTFLKAPPADQATPAFNKALFIGVPALLLAFILASAYITQNEVTALHQDLSQRIAQARSQEELNLLREEYHIDQAYNVTTEIASFDSPLMSEAFALSLSEAYARADRIAGILLLVVLVTIGLSVFIASSLAKDRSKGKERSILSQCFSPAIVNKFYNAPEVIERFYNQWMSVFFIDIRGFTQATEKDSDDVEGLALKLRKVMDTARDEIVDSHEGVIDKFMGDAVMGWVGGHFSAHWDLLEETRRKLYLDELELCNQDIKSIQREINKIAEQDNHTPRLIELNAILEEAQKQKSKLILLQEEAIHNESGLQNEYEKMRLEYRRRVAKSAVNCCLKITHAVSQFEDPDAFHELKIGIGSGRVLVGNFGSTNQIGFTVLGPTVNRAARLEPASAQCGCKILIDQSTYDLLKDVDEFQFRRLPRISVQGISNDMVTYEPFFTANLETSFLSTFEQGVNLLEDGKLDEALICFNQADQRRPGGDAASKLWAKECSDALTQGTSVGIRSLKK